MLVFTQDLCGLTLPAVLNPLCWQRWRTNATHVITFPFPYISIPGTWHLDANSICKLGTQNHEYKPKWWLGSLWFSWLYSNSVFICLQKKIACVISLSYLQRSVSSWEMFGWILLKFSPLTIHESSSYWEFTPLTPLSVAFPDLCLYFLYLIFNMVLMSPAGALILFKFATFSLETSKPWIFLTASTDIGRLLGSWPHTGTGLPRKLRGL